MWATNRDTIFIEGIGSIEITVRMLVRQLITVNNTLYVSGMEENLLLVYKIGSHQINVVFDYK